MKQLEVSFIIPAYNEEESILEVLNSIKNYAISIASYEVIVVDNGSQDGTVRIAQSCDAKVLIDKTLTVGGLRNLGATNARGAVLIFLDADVTLTDEWKKNILSTLRSLKNDPWQVTGSRCGVSRNAGWIERYWFKPLVNNSSNYINSGHLITTRELFSRIEGFDDSLVSGEDYAFSQTAVSANASIRNNPALAVVHEGYPKSLYQFVRREIWHGKGDCESISALMASKVALASMLFMALHASIVVAYLTFVDKSFVLIPISLIVGICIIPAIYKNSARNVASLVAVSILYYCYYMSRFLSCVPDSFGASEIVKRHR